MIYQKRIKPIFDLILSSLAIFVLFPLFAIIGLCIKLESKGPVFFKQKRIGINKTYFYIYKFRTMYTNTPKDMPTHLLLNPEQYITKTGKILRRTSMDELPQIFNIFKGDMSMVGPRPALWNQYDLIQERDRYGANDVRPGLTGWAQINGRDELPVKMKAKLDGEYVRRCNFNMDIECFFKTIIVVIKGNGISEGKIETFEDDDILVDDTFYIEEEPIIKEMIAK